MLRRKTGACNLVPVFRTARLPGFLDAVLFRHHYVQGNWTKPSTASVLTGRFVHQHGVTVGHEPMERGEGQSRWRFNTHVLDDKLETLAERLHAQGVATFAVANNEHLVPAYGFAQGFSEYCGTRNMKEDNRVAEGVGGEHAARLRSCTLGTSPPGKRHAAPNVG